MNWCSDLVSATLRRAGGDLGVVHFRADDEWSLQENSRKLISN